VHSVGLFNWAGRHPSGGSSGAGRWIVKDGKFGTYEYGAGYFEASGMPVMFLGSIPGADKMDETHQWSVGTTHVLVGDNVLKGFTFASDPKYPLTFKLVGGKGYVYLCGRGTVITKSGSTYRLGTDDSVAYWLPLLHSKDPLRAEGAAQALGYLATTPEHKDKALPELIEATRSPQIGVSFNATEALGRIGDSSAVPRLEEIQKEQSGAIIGAVAQECIEKIKKRFP